MDCTTGKQIVKMGTISASPGSGRQGCHYPKHITRWFVYKLTLKQFKTIILIKNTLTVFTKYNIMVYFLRFLNLKSLLI